MLVNAFALVFIAEGIHYLKFLLLSYLRYGGVNAILAILSTLAFLGAYLAFLRLIATEYQIVGVSVLLCVWGIILWKDRRNKVILSLSEPASSGEGTVVLLFDIAFWAALVMSFYLGLSPQGS
jgi:hypothetical protein